MRPTTSPDPFSMGGLRFRGVKLRDLGFDLLTYPPLEKGSKGCRGLQVTVAAIIHTGVDGTARSASALRRNAPLAWPSAERYQFSWWG